MRTLLCLLCLAGALPAAPAPMPRAPRPAPPPPPFVGKWRMQWKGGAYRAEFRPDGGYSCTGGELAGAWNYDPVRGLLEVEEIGQSVGVYYFWRVTLDGPLRGTLDDGTEWSLEEVAK